MVANGPANLAAPHQVDHPNSNRVHTAVSGHQELPTGGQRILRRHERSVVCAGSLRLPPWIAA